MPLEVPPPRSSRFGSPLVLSRVHWVRPELVVEVKYLTWRRITCFVRWSIKVCVRTSQRPSFAVLCRIRSLSWRSVRLALQKQLGRKRIDQYLTGSQFGSVCLPAT
jgi:hypothetical protein